MNKNIFIFPDPFTLADNLAREIVAMVNEAAGSGRIMTIGLSGGSTPLLLYSVLGDHYQASAKWASVHFFWCDERCVDPADSESNFGTAQKAFLGRISIPAENIHRIRGEAEAFSEAQRYSGELRNFVSGNNPLPALDLILLGVGDDGHTASLFPATRVMEDDNRLCLVSSHPVSGQRRISITMDVINNASNVVFVVTGSSKADIIAQIFNNPEKSKGYPAARVKPLSGRLKWYLDFESGRSVAH